MLSLSAKIVCIQKPFVRSWSNLHSRFNFYWPIKEENRKNIWAFITVRKKVANNVVFDNQSNLANHFYWLIFDIKEFHLKTRKLIKKFGVVNIYKNYIRQEHI